MTSKNSKPRRLNLSHSGINSIRIYGNDLEIIILEGRNPEVRIETNIELEKFEGRTMIFHRQNQETKEMVILELPRSTKNRNGCLNIDLNGINTNINIEKPITSGLPMYLYINHHHCAINGQNLPTNIAPPFEFDLTKEIDLHQLHDRAYTKSR